MTSSITIRHLVFTGPSIEPVGISFEDGLNIIYGASDTGKSFTAKAINFMLAATTSLPRTEEVAKYEAAWLGLVLPDNREVTLYRATRGGAFRLHDGLLTSADPNTGKVLQGKFDSKKSTNVSHFLLETIGLANKVVVINANADKEALSIRLLAPYVVVSEEDIIAEKSPVLYSGAPAQRTFERNLFKLLLTGIDDSAAVTVPRPTERKAAKTAKVEFIDELVAQLDDELGDEAPDRKELAEQLETIETSLGSLFENVRRAQTQLDNLVSTRRQLVDSQRELAARVVELDVTIQRFGRLSDVYASDVARLQALEEGGFILVSLAGHDCPVCGAPPSAQRHNHAAEEIALAYKAASAEVAKIEIEQRELKQTVISLTAEAGGLRARATTLRDEIGAIDKRIEDVRPQEASARRSYEALSMAKSRLDKIDDMYDRRDRLLARRSQIEEEEIEHEGRTIAVGIEDTVAFAFGEVVKQVLTAWRFPGVDKAQFDAGANDITIAGKPRSANGKGVRAILHAAFNVAVLMYCRANGLPHPGFVVLDTPLLTYREPLRSRHGALSADEAELKQTNLATHFYEHLASLRDLAQIIIIENSDPPDAIRSLGHIEMFTGIVGQGRFGLFPHFPLRDAIPGT